MSLDLEDLVSGWHAPPGEICARLVEGRDGRELIQLRIDLGLIQMFPDDRPDGSRYHGLPTVAEYMRHELKVGRRPAAADWRELERELSQLNYRRLAAVSLAEGALSRNEPLEAQTHLRRALRDVELCMRIIRMLRRAPVRVADHSGLLPTLAFNRARLGAQLCIVLGWYDEAIEEAERGAEALRGVLLELGNDAEQADQDQGVNYLQSLGKRLRDQYEIAQTLSERLQAAIDEDDFETAKRLREELRQRQQKTRPMLPPPGEVE